VFYGGKELAVILMGFREFVPKWGPCSSVAVNIVVRWLILLLRILEVLGSSPGDQVS
jgi:hypothetical protein